MSRVLNSTRGARFQDGREAKRLFTWPALVVFGLVLAILSACSPRHDWRQVSLADGALRAMFPDRPHTTQRELQFEEHEITFSLSSASVDGVLYTVGYAALPDALRRDAAAKRRLIEQTQASLYYRLGGTPPDTLPAAGERFSVAGQAQGQPLRLEAMVWTTPTSLIEGMVIGDPDRLSVEQVNEFLRELAPDQRPRGAREGPAIAS